MAKRQTPTILVKAGTMADGTPLVVVFPLDIAPAAGRQNRRLTGAEVVEVPRDHRFVIRSRRNGDLVVVKQTGKAKASAARVKHEPTTAAKPKE